MPLMSQQIIPKFTKRTPLTLQNYPPDECRPLEVNELLKHALEKSSDGASSPPSILLRLIRRRRRFRSSSGSGSIRSIFGAGSWTSRTGASSFKGTKYTLSSGIRGGRRSDGRGTATVGYPALRIMSSAFSEFGSYGCFFWFWGSFCAAGTAHASFGGGHATVIDSLCISWNMAWTCRMGVFGVVTSGMNGRRRSIVVYVCEGRHFGKSI